MRLKPSNHWRIGRAIGVLGVAALGCTRTRLYAPGFTETMNASMWACVTLATMSLVYFRQSR